MRKKERKKERIPSASRFEGQSTCKSLLVWQIDTAVFSRLQFDLREKEKPKKGRFNVSVNRVEMTFKDV